MFILLTNNASQIVLEIFRTRQVRKREVHVRQCQRQCRLCHPYQKMKC